MLLSSVLAVLVLVFLFLMEFKTGMYPLVVKKRFSVSNVDSQTVKINGSFCFS